MPVEKDEILVGLAAANVEARIEVVARDDARQELDDANDVGLADTGDALHGGGVHRDRRDVRLRHEDLVIGARRINATAVRSCGSA